MHRIGWRKYRWIAVYAVIGFILGLVLSGIPESIREAWWSIPALIVILVVAQAVVANSRLGGRRQRTDAGRIATIYWECEMAGDPATLWDHLHPAHQSVMSYETWLSTYHRDRDVCWDGYEFVAEYDQKRDVPELGVCDVCVVVFCVKKGWGRFRYLSNRMVHTDDGWKWTIWPDRMESFRQPDSASSDTELITPRVA